MERTFNDWTINKHQTINRHVIVVYVLQWIIMEQDEILILFSLFYCLQWIIMEQDEILILFSLFYCYGILIIHIKHLFTLFLNFYIQSTLNCMTSCHGATPTVNSRCTNPTRVHRSWLRVHDFTRWMERFFTARELVITTSVERSIRCGCLTGRSTFRGVSSSLQSTGFRGND